MRSAIRRRPQDGRRGQRKAPRPRDRFAAPLLVLSLLVQGLLPPGFMPAAAAGTDGGFVLVICSPDGVSTILVDAQGQPLDSEGQTEDGPEGDRALRCAYAGPGATQLGPPPSFAGPAGFVLSAEPPRPRPERLPRTLPTGSLGSRAPPLRT